MKKLKKLKFNKAKLAFDMLEKEMKLISKHESSQYVGGDPLPQGYCFFNAMSYILDGNSNSATFYYDTYAANNEVSTGTGSSGAWGIEMSYGDMLDSLDTWSYGGASLLTGGDIFNTISQGNDEVMMVYKSGSVQHAVVVTGMASTGGGVDYIDPTTGLPMTNFTPPAGTQYFGINTNNMP